MKLYALGPYLFQTILRPIVRRLLEFFCKLEVHGLEHIDSLDENFILVSNHIHELDGFLIPASIPLSVYSHPIFPVSREEEYYWDKGLRGKLFYGGLFFKFMGAYPAFSGLENYKKSLHNQLQILKNHSVLIFPQERVGGDSIKGGVGYLALETDKPIIQVRIDGIKGMNFWDFMLRRHHLRIAFKEHEKFQKISLKRNSNNTESIYKKAAQKMTRDL